MAQKSKRLEITNLNGTKATITQSTDLHYTNNIGIHGFFSGFTSSSTKTGVIENWSSEYARYQEALTTARTARQQITAHTSHTSELKYGSREYGKYLLVNDSRDDSRTPNESSFCFTPQIALNKSNINIDYDKTEDVKLSIRLVNPEQVLDGADAGGFTYNIKELQIEYKTVPNKTSGALQMEVIQMVRTTAESNNTNISTKVPIIARSMTCLFRQQRQLDNASQQHILLEEPPDIERVEFQFNDSTQNYITYVLDNREELLYNYQLSLGADPMNSKSLLTLNNQSNKNDPFGIGITFGEYIDMSNNKIGFNLKSGIVSDNPYALFMYFRGLVSI